MGTLLPEVVPVVAMKRGVLLIVGRTGSGKSVLARRFLLEIPRSIAFDTHGEYGGVEIHDPLSLAAYVNDRGAGRFRVSYRDTGEGPGVLETMRMLHSVRDCWIVLEEASLWLGSSGPEEAAHWFLQYGRHNAISVLLVARRSYEISPLARANADVVVSFRQHEPRDLEWIRQVGGEDAARRIETLDEEAHEWDYVVANHPGIVSILDSISKDREHGGDDNGSLGDLAGDHADPGSGDSLAVAPKDGEGGEGARDRTAGARSAGAPPPVGAPDADSDLEDGDATPERAPNPRHRRTAGGGGRGGDSGKA